MQNTNTIEVREPEIIIGNPLVDKIQMFHQVQCTKHEYIQVTLTTSPHPNIIQTSWQCRFCGKPLK